MAKKKTKIRRIFVKPKRKVSRKGGNKQGIGTLMGAMLYGGLRAPINNFAQSKIPNVSGELADEIIMGALSYATANGMIPIVKNFKMSRDIGKAGLAVEGARVGEYLADKFMNKTTSSTSTNAFVATLG